MVERSELEATEALISELKDKLDSSASHHEYKLMMRDQALRDQVRTRRWRSRPLCSAALCRTCTGLPSVVRLASDGLDAVWYSDWGRVCAFHSPILVFHHISHRPTDPGYCWQTLHLPGLPRHCETGLPLKRLQGVPPVSAQHTTARSAGASDRRESFPHTTNAREDADCCRTACSPPTGRTPA